MANTDQNVEIWEGEYREIPFTVQDAAGVAVNLTGATLSWRMTRGGPTGTTVLTKTPTVVSAASGTGKITLAEADTVDIGGVTYYHELVVEDSAGHSEVGFIGAFKIRKSAIL